MKREVPASVDAYLESVENPEFRRSLERLREIIRKEIPEAQEVISYGVPTFKLNGMLGSYAAFREHCSFFPGAIVGDFAADLKAFKTSKGTVQFTPDHELPEPIIRAMVRRNADRNRAKKRR